MAQLHPPTEAWRYRHLGKRAKYHLTNPRTSHRDYQQSVCSCLYWADDENVEVHPISGIPAEQICQKCLGAMQATD